MEKSTERIIRSVLYTGFATLLWSCSSTEVIEDIPAPGLGKTITLSIASPEPSATRAADGFVLRYVAKLCPEDATGTTVFQRKEALAADDKATITFSVEEGEYRILLFADYIPAGSQKDENGCYPDYYYSTTNNLPQEIKLTRFEFNTDAPDSFAERVTVKKGAEEVVRDITLRRVVGKVCFVSTTSVTDGQTLSSVTVDPLNYYTTLNLDALYSGQYFGYGTTSERKKSEKITIPVQTQPSADATQVELFSYYTFANRSQDQGMLGDISFSVSFGDNTKKDFEVPATKNIAARCNRRTIVQGAFVNPLPPKLGDIILNLSKPDGWDTDVTETFE